MYMCHSPDWKSRIIIIGIILVGVIGKTEIST